MSLASPRELLKSDNRIQPEMACGPGREGWSKASWEAAWDSWSRMTAQNGRDGVGPEGTTDGNEGKTLQVPSVSLGCHTHLPG